MSLASEPWISQLRKVPGTGSLDEFRPPGLTSRGLTHKCRLSLCHGCCGCVCAGCWGCERTVHTADMGTASPSVGITGMQGTVNPKTVLGASFFSEEADRKEDASRTQYLRCQPCPWHQEPQGSCRGGGSDLAGQTEGLHTCQPHLPDQALFHVGHVGSPDLEPTPGTPGRSSLCSSAGAWPQPCGWPSGLPQRLEGRALPLLVTLEGWAAQQALEGQGGLKMSLLRTGDWTARPSLWAHSMGVGDRGSDTDWLAGGVRA